MHPPDDSYAVDPLESPQVLAALIQLAGTRQGRDKRKAGDLQAFIEDFHTTLQALLDVTEVVLSDRLGPLLDALDELEGRAPDEDSWGSSSGEFRLIK